VKQFQQIMWVALIAGACSGLVLFSLQHFTVRPIIHEAEAYEARAEQEQVHADPARDTGEPSEGWQRAWLTALATVLTSIAYCALLFGLASLWEVRMNAGRGILWGLGGFASFVLAPALGLPPEPPGVAAADLQARQLWWAATALATAGGLLLALGASRGWPVRIAGLFMLLLPHLVGAPRAAAEQLVPDDLILRFRIASIGTNALFWIMAGALGGYLTGRAGNPARP
jgi:cobalt transporter subunit CbtA